MLNADIGVGCGSNSGGCSNSGSCPAPPDLCIKRHDTRPAFSVSMSDCDGPVDLTQDGIVLEASMWFDAKLKSDVSVSSDSVRFADGVGFESVAVGDVIAAVRSRSPERMLVTAIDESEKTVQVTRGHEGTNAQAWPRGTALKIFRFYDEPAVVESVFETEESLDGSSNEYLADTLLKFEWSQGHTGMPGCYWLEFKILKMSAADPPVVQWIKRVPLSAEGFMINIIDSPTSPA